VVLDHLVEHIELAVASLLGIVHGIPHRRSRDEAGKSGSTGKREGRVVLSCRLIEIELFDRYAVVVLAGRLYAGGAVAEIQRGQVAREDLVLAQMLLEPDGKTRLAQLAQRGPLAAGVDVLHVLLRDRRPTLQ